MGATLAERPVCCAGTTLSAFIHHNSIIIIYYHFRQIEEYQSRFHLLVITPINHSQSIKLVFLCIDRTIGIKKYIDATKIIKVSLLKLFNSIQ